jgi:2-keto-4-pentenoate hydratase/2-oxohepta-3-ene-1,7-dioic acid hydratase in catechol pathway
LGNTDNIMRFIKFTAAAQTSWGIVEGDRIVAISGDPFDKFERSDRTHTLAEVKIEVPLIPRTFYCAGLNYVRHLKEAADKRGEVPNIPTRAEIGYRAQNALIAHDEDVVIPRDATEQVHYEGELVAVIGRKAKHLSEKDALSCVFGYTIGNDVSAHLAARGSHVLAFQEHRHVQADGPVDRDRRRPRRHAHQRAP